MWESSWVNNFKQDESIKNWLQPIPKI